MSLPLPVIVYPEALPVSQRRDDIMRAIRDHQVVIVAGATGSGKTTQLPKMCLELGRTAIAHTQPRRLAARTIAERVAEELGEEVGGLVGYRVRFTDKVGKNTRIALMTDGILLNEIHRDRQLRRYDTIIIDEAHERSLNIDFLLGYLKRILPERPELRVIITSATIDPESFAKFYATASGEPAPIIEVSGRTFPVEVRYRPLVAESDPDADDGDTSDTDRANTADDKDYLEGIVAGLAELDREAPGDVLVFLSGEAEIKDAAEAVRAAYAHASSPTEVLPLYGRLSAADQHRVFEPSRVAGVKRRVVLATNVAETSLTVPGIRYVIDAGTARISRYSVRSKVQRLPIEAISQASAQQRSGRAGRTSDGIAIRLYSEEDFTRRPEFTEPEILRTSLASVILQMLSLGFGDLTAFPFVQPPDSRGIKDGIELLTELGAIRMRRPRAGDTPGAATPELTKIGRDLSRLPIDPRFARMVIESAKQNTGREVLAIVSGLTVQDVRERPLEHRERADQLHARFTDPTSDFLSLLNLWNYLQEQQGELGSSAFRRMCRSEHLNYLRVREWQDVYRQLRQLSGSVGVTINEPAVNPDGIHRSLLAGLLSHLGVKDAAAATRAPAKRSQGAGPGSGPRPKGDYIGARHVRFAIFPGSGLAKKQPQAVMAAELVETSRLFARTVAQIDPAWAEALAGDLAKRSVSEPHWEKSQGAAVAFEKVTLYGVEIIPRRRIQFSRVDPEGARELFIRHALVEGEWDVSRLDKRLTAFDRDNRALRRRLEEVEERTRRRDILVDDEAVVDFYEQRVPAQIASVRTFEKWWRTARATTPDLLTMREDDLLPPSENEETDEAQYPSHWQQGDQRLALRYRFEPGASDDGVTVIVPLPLLASLKPDGFDWQVPGTRTELIAALIRALPKPIRRHVVPAADFAAKFAEELDAAGPELHDGFPPRTLRAALAALVAKIAYQPVTADAFEMERVPAHLLVSFRAVDEKGRPVGDDSDLGALQARLQDQARASVARTTGAQRPDAGARRGPRAPRAEGANAHAPTGASATGAAVTTGARAASVIERSGITTWDVGEVPRVVDTPVAGGVVRGYPALVDDGTSVSLRIESTPERQHAAMRGGVRRLVLLAVASPVSYVQEHLSSAEKLTLAASPYPSARVLIEDCRAAVAEQLIETIVPGGAAFTEDAFNRARDAVSSGIVDGLFACVALTARILARARDAERLLAKQNSMTLLGALSDVRAQLAGLIHPNFISRTGAARLPHLLRYLNAVAARLEGLADNPGRDRQRMTEYERAAALFTAAGGSIPLPADAPPTLVRTRWLLEELRVSLFAQQLGTPEPVSVQRVAKALATG